MTACDECGAPVPAPGACLDHFHGLLALEQRLLAESGGHADEPGKVAHFYAVSAYILQHPVGMAYTREALAGVRRNLAAHLAGRVTLDAVLAETRRKSDGPARITRRPGDAVPGWSLASWPLTVADVAGDDLPAYLASVTAWARSCIEALATSEP